MAIDEMAKSSEFSETKREKAWGPEMDGGKIEEEKNEKWIEG